MYTTHKAGSSRPLLDLECPPTQIQNSLKVSILHRSSIDPSDTLSELLVYMKELELPTSFVETFT